jgi:hypothetical protein
VLIERRRERLERLGAQRRAAFAEAVPIIETELAALLELKRFLLRMRD